MEEQEKETIRHTTFLLCRHLTERAGDGLSITCSENQGSRDGVGRDVWLKLKVGKGEDLRGLIFFLSIPKSMIRSLC